MSVAEPRAVSPAADTAADSAHRVWKRRRGQWVLYDDAPRAAAASDLEQLGEESGVPADSVAVECKLLLRSGTITFHMPKGARVSKLRAMLCEKTGLAPSSIRVVARASVADDNTPIAQLVTRTKDGASVARFLVAGITTVHRLVRYTPDQLEGSWYFASPPFRPGAGSPDAILVTVSANIMVVGITVAGNRTGGEYTTEISVHEGNRGGRGSSSALGSAVHTYVCDAETGMAELRFDDPIPLTAGVEYTLAVTVFGPHGLYGSGGLAEVVHEDTGTVFTFGHSSMSHNGTDVHSGNLPEILFTM